MMTAATPPNTCMASTWVSRNQHGKEVMTGRAEGVIRT